MKNDGFPFMTSLQMIRFFWSCFFGNVDQLRRYGAAQDTRWQIYPMCSLSTDQKTPGPFGIFQSPPQNIENCPSFHPPKYREGGRGGGRGNNYKDPVTGHHMGHLSKLWDEPSDKKIIKTLPCQPRL